MSNESTNIVNLSMDSNTPKNFFSSLQTQSKPSEEEIKKEVPSEEEIKQELPSEEEIKQELPSEEVPSEEVPSEESEKPINFLNKINSTQKVLGNNKFQQKIEDLERELSIYKKYNTEQDMKINLFKKTIANLQTQLHEKVNQINTVQSTETSTYTNQINDLTSKLELATKDNINLLEKIKILEGDIENKNSDFEKIKLEYFSVVDKITEIKQLYTTLETRYQTQVNDIQKNKLVINSLEKQLNLETTIKQNLKSELDLLKTEVADYRKNINNIRIEKDNEIASLMDKLNNATQNIQIKELKQEPKIIKKENVVGRVRGTNMTTRGANRTR